MIRQICYLSSVNEALDAEALTQLVERARITNAALQVTGLLAYGEGHFFQVLEGPRDNIASAFARLTRDGRHHDIHVLQDEMISSRDFAGFPLAFRPLDSRVLLTLDSFSWESAIPMIIGGLGHELPVQATRESANAAA